MAGVAQIFINCLYVYEVREAAAAVLRFDQEVKAAKARIYTTFEESNDPCVRGAKLKVDGGRKADTPKSVSEAKSRLRMEEIVGIPNKGKEGLGLNPRRYYSSSAKDVS